MRFRGSVLAAVALISLATLTQAQEIKVLSTDQRVLVGTEWRLVSIGPSGAETNLVPGTTVTLKFGEDGRATGSTGCNSYGGSYGAVGDTISFQTLISTRRACLDQRANQQEQRFLTALGAANRFRLSANRLTILSDRGRGTLNFVNSSDTGPGEGPRDDRTDPIATLASYYSAINARDYRRAYRYWETPASSFEQFAAGFADTDRVRLLIEPSARVDGAAGSAYAEISTIVVATTRAGNERVFAGCYTMRRSNVQDRGWLIYRANISQVPSSVRISRMLSQVCN
ncbi:MAG TPA: META domain-containing protein [Pyrinomonadaceae bacterium]|jgi:heat shock protein HslJ|nr:META domain-containing protein [Pyrinomonadaceae bacterium]